MPQDFSILEKNTANSPAPWLRSKWYDIAFFHLCAPLLLLLIIPCAHLSPKTLLVMYGIQLLFFALPHTFLMCFFLNPAVKDESVQYGPVIFALCIASILAACYGFTDHVLTKQLITSSMSYIGLWHMVRQQQGICRVYDQAQMKRSGDSSIRKDGNFTIWLIAFCYYLPFARYSTQGAVDYNYTYYLSPSNLPIAYFNIYCFLMAISLFLFVRVVVWNRLAAHREIPWPQISMAAVSVFTAICLTLWVPKNAFVLYITITTTAHAVQHFGFIWLFEKHRTGELQNENPRFPIPQRFIFENKWGLLTLFIFTCSLLAIVVMILLGSAWGTAVLIFFFVFHYLSEGFIWRSKYNGRMRSFALNLAQMA